MPITNNFIYPEGALIVLTKSPELGRVKTRMQPMLSQEQSLEIHSTLAQYVVNLWQKSKLCPLYYFVKGDERVLEQKIPAYNDQQLFVQGDGDLGDKMLSAANTIADQYQPKFIILLGTDCPFITKSYLQQAVSALSNHDVVVGPADDGGYVLLGFTVVHEALFKNIAWSSDQVLIDTLAMTKKNNISVKLLNSLSDIDYPNDLIKLEPIKALTHIAKLAGL